MPTSELRFANLAMCMPSGLKSLLRIGSSARLRFGCLGADLGSRRSNVATSGIGHRGPLHAWCCLFLYLLHGLLGAQLCPSMSGCACLQLFGCCSSIGSVAVAVASSLANLRERLFQSAVASVHQVLCAVASACPVGHMSITSAAESPSSASLNHFGRDLASVRSGPPCRSLLALVGG
mmetsp:Transcript_41112/g.132228  ORF Transcript_41112/g.132228 Transcript_41112/m.132228 type:complete len:178 (-) Transcript_41112:333-866(-)